MINSEFEKEIPELMRNPILGLCKWEVSKETNGYWFKVGQTVIIQLRNDNRFMLCSRTVVLDKFITEIDIKQVGENPTLNSILLYGLSIVKDKIRNLSSETGITK